MDGDDPDGVCDDQPIPVLAPLPAYSWADQGYMTGPILMRKKEKKNIYYINDGIYGTFNAIVFDQKTFIIHYLRMSPETHDNKDACSTKKEKFFTFVLTNDKTDRRSFFLFFLPINSHTADASYDITEDECKKFNRLSVR